MERKTNKKEKVCWACKRILVEKSKTGLCPNCINKYGTPAAAVLGLGLTALASQAVKHSGKAVKFVGNAIKHIKKV